MLSASSVECVYYTTEMMVMTKTLNCAVVLLLQQQSCNGNYGRNKSSDLAKVTSIMQVFILSEYKHAKEDLRMCLKCKDDSLRTVM